jgi:hypothetical protein
MALVVFGNAEHFELTFSVLGDGFSVDCGVHCLVAIGSATGAVVVMSKGEQPSLNVFIQSTIWMGGVGDGRVTAMDSLGSPGSGTFRVGAHGVGICKEAARQCPFTRFVAGNAT